VQCRPNILFVFSDQQHWQAVGFEDSSFCTPNLDRLAADSTVFANSFCTTPQCSPSRSSILTGRYPSRTGVLGNLNAAGGNPLRMPTIAATLQRRGYRTAYFGKWRLGKDPVGTAGWDEDFGVTGPAAAEPANLPMTWHRKDLSTVPAVQNRFMTEGQGRVIVGKETPAWQRYREIYREKAALYDDEVGKVLAAATVTVDLLATFPESPAAADQLDLPRRRWLQTGKAAR